MKEPSYVAGQSIGPLVTAAIRSLQGRIDQLTLRSRVIGAEKAGDADADRSPAPVGLLLQFDGEVRLTGALFGTSGGLGANVQWHARFKKTRHYPTRRLAS